MSDVTGIGKRYIYLCAGCDLLYESKRIDKMTCSNACRVKAHRNGMLKGLQDLAKGLGITDKRTGKPFPAKIAHISAIAELCPELMPKLDAQEVTVYEAMPATVSKYRELVKAIQAERDT